jgi:hypothetical protein
LAEQAQLENEYSTFYSILSDIAHVSPVGLRHCSVSTGRKPTAHQQIRGGTDLSRPSNQERSQHIDLLLKQPDKHKLAKLEIAIENAIGRYQS